MNIDELNLSLADQSFETRVETKLDYIICGEHSRPVGGSVSSQGLIGN